MGVLEVEEVVVAMAVAVEADTTVEVEAVGGSQVRATSVEGRATGRLIAQVAVEVVGTTAEGQEDMLEATTADEVRKRVVS